MLTINDNTYIVMFLPYYPNEQNASEIFIDNYYPAYLKLRKIKQATKEYLLEKGYELIDNKYFHKDLALKTGKVSLLKNTLVAHPDFGSFFGIEVLAVSGDYGGIEPQEAKLYPTCSNCSLCVKNCPTNALEKGFLRSRCIRNLQNSGYIEDVKFFEKLGNRLWGCNTCQIVCPANKNVLRKPFVAPQLLDAKYFFDCATKGKKGLAEYIDILGDNYIRPVRLTALIINIMSNLNITSDYDAIKLLTDNREEKIRLASLRYMEKVKNIEREVKYLITKQDYLKATQAHSGKLQINHYFLSDNNTENVLRIRVKEDKYELTLKIKRETENDVFVSDEYNRFIEKKDFDKYIAKGIGAIELNEFFKLNLPQQLHFDYIGFLNTLRTSISIESFIFEFDKNSYLDVVDYEIECECKSCETEQVKAIIKNNYTTSVTKPKILRYIDRLTKINKYIQRN